MVLIDLYFGRDIPGRAPLTDAEWAGFAREQITPRFPNGFTMIDAQGQWRNAATLRIGAEATKMVRIATAEDTHAAASIGEILQAYRQQFHQLAVGITSTETCGAF